MGRCLKSTRVIGLATTSVLTASLFTATLSYAQTPPAPAPSPATAPATQFPGYVPLSSMMSGSGEVDPIVEWDKRSNIAQELTAHGLDVMGDNIDPHTGTISFQHTDIDVPGNSALPVALTRKLTQGYYHKFSVDAEFGDWSYDVPRLHLVTHSDWTGARCSNPTSVFGIESYPNAGGYSGLAYPVEYSNGLMLDAPGSGSQQVLQKSASVTTPFPAAAKHVTANNWYLTCGSASDGGEGFIAKAPNGDTYRFDHYIKYDHVNLGSFGPDGENSSDIMPLSRVKVMLMATEVTDVHGNWVRYVYDGSNRLTQIHANDGRSITLSYSGASKVIASAATSGRTWTYNYTSTSVSNTFLGDFNVAKKILTSVNQPDNKSWSFSLVNMHRRPYSGTVCINNGGTMSMTHPNGAVGTFEISEKNHRNGFAHWRIEASQRCSGAFPPPPGTITNYDLIHETMDTMSVTRKTITGNDIPMSEWLYSYEEDFPVSRYPVGHPIEGHPIPSSSTDPTNWTKVVGPDGVENTFYHYWNIMTGGGPHLHAGTAFGGKLARMEVRSTAGGTIVETRQNDYIQTGTFGGSYIPNNYPPLAPISLVLSPLSAGVPVEIEKTVVARDGDTYTTETDYNINQSSSAYSYSLPIATRTFSNVSTTPRQRTTTYEHNATKWILGLPKTTTIAGTQVAGFTYNANGLKIAQTRYTLPWATFGYNPDGTMSWFRDALNRQTQALNWKRGQPQTVIFPDITSLSRAVDNNGWVTSQTDPKSQTTAYQYDTMGRLTLIDPPSNFFDPTVIAYDLTGPGIEQTVTRGNSETVITYDSLLRPALSQSRETATGWEAYVKTDYDAMSRPVFTSFPSASASPTDGRTTTYDALSRVKTQADNVAPYATTRYDYLSSNRTKVTDPHWQPTTTWKDGYGGPGGGDVIKIQQPQSVTTDLLRDNLGNVTSVTQSGGGTSTSRNYYYDGSQRLCRYVTPEAGHTLYQYDTANQLTAYARGAAAGTGCAAPTGNERVQLTYWPRGGLRATAFNDGVTPDIERTYDPNLNPTQVYRGSGGQAVHWDYEYDEMDHLTRETMTLDGRIYDTRYQYNPLGHLTKTTLPGGPSGTDINYTPDALGRDLSVQIGSANLIQNVTYHPGGIVNAMTYGNGFGYGSILDDRQNPIRLWAYNTNGVRIFDQQYSYYATGRLAWITDLADANNTGLHGYDGLGRLNYATGPWGAGSYVYDALGNILTKARGARTVTNVHDASNRLIRSLDSLSPSLGGQGDRWATYDGRGNMQQFGPTWMAYDKSYQMTASTNTSTGAVTSYKYDGKNKRVRLITASPSAAMMSGSAPSSRTADNLAVLTSAARTSESRSSSSLPPSDVSDILTELLSDATEGRSERERWDTAEAMVRDARPIYADTKRSGFDAYREVAPRRGTARSVDDGYADTTLVPAPVSPPVPSSGALPVPSSASPGVSSGLSSGIPAAVSTALTTGGSASSASAACNGPTDETIYNVYNAAGQLVLVDEAHLCRMTVYARGAGMELTRVEFDTAAGTTSRTYVHADRLGTVLAASDPFSPLAIWREHYSPYGEKLAAVSATDDQGGFTGHITDRAPDTSLTYMQARYYDPVASRFTSVDPVTFLDTGNPGMVNRYGYALGDPVNMVDPDGNNPVAIIGLGAACASAAPCRIAAGAIGGAVVGGGAALITETTRGSGVDWGNVRTATGKGAVVGGVTAATGNYKLGVATAAVIGAGQGALGSDASTPLGVAVDAAGQATADAAGAFAGAKVASELGSGLAGSIVGETTAIGLMQGAQLGEHIPGAVSEIVDGLSELSETLENTRDEVVDRFIERSTPQD